MNGSPLTSWEGVEAYYTYADSPMLIALFVILTAAVTVGAIWHSVRHETEAFARFPDQ